MGSETGAVQLHLELGVREAYGSHYAGRPQTPQPRLYVLDHGPPKGQKLGYHPLERRPWDRVQDAISEPVWVSLGANVNVLLLMQLHTTATVHARLGSYSMAARGLGA